MKKHPFFLIAISAMTMLVACSAKDKTTVKTTPNKAYRTPAVSAPAMRNPNISLPSDISSVKGISYSRVKTNLPYIAITFDDGPNPTNTPRLLDMLKKRNIKATFYVVGKNASQYPSIIRRIVAEGHEIGSHSWSHPNFSKMSNSAIRAELTKTENAIVAASGVRPRTLRPPYGALRSSQRAWVNKEFGYRIILWDVDPLDWKRPGPSVVTSRILSHTHNGSIILAHDLHKSTVDAMPATLDGLLRRGFKFVTVSQLIALGQSTTPPTNTTPAPAMAPVSTTPEPTMGMGL